MNIKEYRFIENEEITQEISAKSEAKIKEDLGNEYRIGRPCNFEVDIHNIGNVLAYYPILQDTDFDSQSSSDAFVGNVITPLYIPDAKNLAEVLNDLISNKHIKFQVFPPIIKKGMLGGLKRYMDTSIIIIFLFGLINVDEDDCIYNVIPPKGLNGIFAIHEANENGQIFKTLIDITNFKEPKIIQTNRPKTGIFNRLFRILNYPFHEKYNNGKEYFKL